MSAIDRVRYYDGEFLRAFDFGDEQIYHLEMRRRLNRYLHLYGIVQGLILVAATDGIGVTLSRLGHRCVRPRDLRFRSLHLRRERHNHEPHYIKGHLRCMAALPKTPGTPPSSGYGKCNQTNQYTRWDESFSVPCCQVHRIHLPLPASPITTRTIPARIR